MRHRKKLKTLGLKKSHRESLLKNLIASLVINEKIKTTDNRAKALAQKFDRLMSLVKKQEEREAIRTIAQQVFTATASRKLISELKPRYENRTSGFTRITRLGLRKGDSALLVQIELV